MLYCERRAMPRSEETAERAPAAMRGGSAAQPRSAAPFTSQASPQRAAFHFR